MKIYSVLAVLLITDVSLAHGLQQRYILENERDMPLNSRVHVTEAE